MCHTILLFFRYLFISCVVLSAGCSSIGKITNVPVSELPDAKQRYSFTNHIQRYGLGDTLFILAFSGGGTRASALSYGVLEELRDTWYEVDGQQLRLLDEIDRINGVSGGSFTAAYFGLFGDEIFTDFKNDVLYEDIEGELKSSIFNIFHFIGRLFHSTSRTEAAIKIYDKYIFRDKTFGDIQNSDNPFILINATDLNSHEQFVFSQDYFDFLCTDISQLKVSRAVAASSAVPILFDPILIENHHDCNHQKPSWLTRAEDHAVQNNDLRLQELVKSYKFFLDPANPPYATLVDGGVTDNLGLRAFLSNAMLLEWTDKLDDLLESIPPIKRVVLLVVNASTTAYTEIGKTKKLPSISDVFTAVTDIQLHRYNLESNSLLRNELFTWAQSISKPGNFIEPYFIELSIEDAKNQDSHIYFNKIPTSLSLEREQVDKIIDTAKQLLRNDPVYKKLLHDLKSSEKKQGGLDDQKSS